MSENVALIKEINEPRREIKDEDGAARQGARRRPAGSPRARPSGEAPATMAEAVQKLDVHREEVRGCAIGSTSPRRARRSRCARLRERLPVMDGMPAGLSETVAQEAPPPPGPRQLRRVGFEE